MNYKPVNNMSSSYTIYWMSSLMMQFFSKIVYKSYQQGILISLENFFDQMKIQMVRNLIREGLTKDQIQKIFNISENSINGWLNKDCKDIEESDCLMKTVQNIYSMSKDDKIKTSSIWHLMDNKCQRCIENNDYFIFKDKKNNEEKILKKNINLCRKEVTNALKLLYVNNVIENKEDIFYKDGRFKSDKMKDEIDLYLNSKHLNLMIQKMNQKSIDINYYNKNLIWTRVFMNSESMPIENLFNIEQIKKEFKFMGEENIEKYIQSLIEENKIEIKLDKMKIGRLYSSFYEGKHKSEINMFHHVYVILESLESKMFNQETDEEIKKMTTGSTYTFDLWKDHEYEKEYKSIFKEIKDKIKVLQEKRDIYEKSLDENILKEKEKYRIGFYIGQSFLGKINHNKE
jgi:hypothetical protein